jgi:hypothetical protein
MNNSMKNAEPTTTREAAAAAEQGATVAPAKAASTKAANQKKGAPRGQKTAKGAKPRVAPKKAAKAAKSARTKEAIAPRAASKGGRILELIGRSKGATLAEIMKVTDWQAHSVRGFLSTAGKKHGLKIESTKNEDGERTYKIAK